MRRIAVALIVLFVSTVAWAAQPAEQLVQQYYQMEAVAYRTQAEMSLISNQDSPALQARLDKVIELGELYSNELSEQWPEIAQQWQLTRQFIEDNRGYEAHSQASFAARLEVRMNELYQSLEQQRPDSKQLDNSVRLLLSLDKILAGYAFFNATIFGGHAILETHIEAEVAEFDRNLNNIANQELKQQLETHWQFIRETVLAYNERSAVFIVDRTGHKMRLLLLQQIDQQV